MTAEHGWCDDERLKSLAVLALQIALKHVPKQEAEDIAQGAIAAFLVRQQNVDNPVSNPEAYITRVTYNLVLALWDIRKRYVLTGDATETTGARPDPTQEDPFDQALDRLLAEAIVEEEVAPLLTHRERQVLSLKADGRSRREISQLLGVTPETVKDTMRRVKRKIPPETEPGYGGGLL
jgi:RNA polymerase sigma factor (sigma-70 family)